LFVFISSPSNLRQIVNSYIYVRIFVKLKNFKLRSLAQIRKTRPRTTSRRKGHLFLCLRQRNQNMTRCTEAAARALEVFLLNHGNSRECMEANSIPRHSSPETKGWISLRMVLIAPDIFLPRAKPPQRFLAQARGNFPTRSAV
jgi:hypothetical protein